jgi:hypothetical protein
LRERCSTTGRGERRHAVLSLLEFSVKPGAVLRPLVNLPIQIAADHN